MEILPNVHVLQCEAGLFLNEGASVAVGQRRAVDWFLMNQS